MVVGGAAIAGQRAVARPGPPAKVAWAVNIGAWGRPAADGTMAFFLTGAHDVVAVSAADGHVVWAQATGDADPDVGTGVNVSGETVVAGDYDLTAYDRASGQLLWKFAPREGYAPGASLGDVRDGVVVTGSSDGRVHAVDLQSGQARWTAVLTANTSTHVYGPIIAGDLVVAGYTTFRAPTTGGVVALDVLTGEARWHVALPASSNPLVGVGAAGSPLRVDDLVVVSNRDGSIHGLRRADGAAVWRIEGLDLPLIPNSPIPEPPGPKPDIRALARSGRRLFAGSLTGHVVAYDLDTRARRWRHLGAQNGSIGFQIAADDRTVYFPAFSGRLTAVRIADGTERWRYGDYLNRVLWPPALVGNRAYVSGLGGFAALEK
jgi:outer membrane protein assembly factor BamB